MDWLPPPHPLMLDLPWFCELAPPIGAVLSVGRSEVTPLPMGFFGGCTTC